VYLYRCDTVYGVGLSLAIDNSSIGEDVYSLQDSENCEIM